MVEKDRYPGVSLSRLVQAFKTVVLMIVGLILLMSVFTSLSFIIWDFLTGLTKTLLGDSLSQDWLDVLYVLEFGGAVFLIIAVVALIVRTRYLWGTKVLIDKRDVMERHFEKKFHLERPTRFVFEYELSIPPNGIVEENQPREYLKLHFENLDNGKETSLLLEPTKGFSHKKSRWGGIFGLRYRYRYTKPLHVISNKYVENICDGSNFRLRIKYNGEKKYSFKFRVKE
jgi:hypothetical protein